MRDLAVLGGAPEGDVIPLPTTKKVAIHTNLRQSAAMASGLEALAVRALECGEATDKDLEDIADLSARLKEDLNRAALVISQLADNN
ncbi:hypothetical protein [Aeromonas jandaei]|uniref:hypothetical protein n=1 Tax=Aeromonas jandaei TaxID=650 RepID=UPI002B0527FD|nr:hypothetical protein [Aeromonas jandaei]